MRRNGLDWREMPLHAVLPMLIALALAGRHVRDILGGALINPDSYMRLVRLRDSLDAHQALHGVGRDASGQGTVLHWSHLLDSLLCLLAAPLQPFLGWDAALHAAGVVFGPLSLGALGLAIAWAASPFAERRWLWLGPVLACLSPAIGAYGLPGVVHHHVAVVVVAVMAWGWAARLVLGADLSAGRALGAWAGLGVWLTPESVPLTVMAFGALWVAWVFGQRRDIARAMGGTGATFLLVVLAALLVDPPSGGVFAMEIDRVSIIFAGLAAAMAATAYAIGVLDRLDRGPAFRLVASASCGVLACAAWLACCPRVLHGPAALMSDAEWRDFMGWISEMQPVATPGGWLQYLATGVVATLFAGWHAARRRDPVLAFAALCGLGLVLAGQRHVRFAAYAEAAAAITLPIAVTAVEARVAAWPGIMQPLARLPVILLFLLVPYAGSLAGGARAAERDDGPRCAVSGLAGMLAPYDGLVVLANVNDSPELLYRTGLRTVGSLYHRNPAAFLRLRAAWRSRALDRVPPDLAATQASLVLFCATRQRSPLVRDLPDDTLFDRLNRAAPPSWLHRVAVDPDSGQTLYRIVP